MIAGQQAIDSGKVLGPTIYSTSALIDGDPPIWDGSEVAAAPAEARKIVAPQRAAGTSDFKLCSLLKPGLFASIVDEAKANGMRFVGHAPDAVGLANALDSGMASIEPLTGYIPALQREDAAAVDYSFSV